MDKIQRITRKIKTCTLYQYSRVSNLIGKLQNQGGTCTEKTFLSFPRMILVCLNIFCRIENNSPKTIKKLKETRMPPIPEKRDVSASHEILRNLKQHAGKNRHSYYL